MSITAGLTLSMMIVAAFYIYILPAIIATRRQHKRENAVLILTLLFGWTVVGWMLLFTWALTGEQRRPERFR